MVIQTRENITAARDGWLGVEYRHLAALAAIAQTGSFRGAAQRLGYVQSAVSQQLALLERIVGTRLVDRGPGPKPVTLTDAGEVMLHHADAILSAFQAARVDLTSIGDDAAPAQIRLGVAQAATSRLLARILPEFTRQWRGTRLVPREAGDEDALLDLVEGGEVDIALVELPHRTGAFRSEELVADPHVLLVHADSAFAALRRPLCLEELLTTRLIVPSGSRRVLAHLRAMRIPLDPVSHSVTDVTAQSLVVAGVGAAVVPRLAAEAAGDRARSLDLSDLVPPRRLGICWHAQRQVGDALAGFSEAARTVGRELAGAKG